MFAAQVEWTAAEQVHFVTFLERFPNESSQGIISLGDAWKHGQAYATAMYANPCNIKTQPGVLPDAGANDEAPSTKPEESTHMRLTDVRTVRMPVDGKLRFKASKTDKWAYFDVTQSPVLTALIERRGNADSVMLLCTSTGRPVSYSMLRGRYDHAREAAALKHPAMAEQIRGMYLRDTRKRAADLATDLEAASALLQHSSKKLTSDHYRQKATELKAVR